MKVYLSGPMTGIGDWNFAAFHDAAYKLREQGHIVFNPAEACGGDTTLDWHQYMTKDIAEISRSEAVVVLPDWQNSLGAIIECLVAVSTGKPIYNLNMQILFAAKNTRQDALDILSLSDRLVQDNKYIPQDDSVLLEAQRLVHGSRQEAYGHPFDDFSKTATMWQVILGCEVDPHQVALCMAAVKISRQVNKPKRDNLVDLAGYAETAQMVLDEQQFRQNWM